MDRANMFNGLVQNLESSKIEEVVSREEKERRNRTHWK